MPSCTRQFAIPCHKGYRCRVAPGLSMLEVVLATIILALTIATLATMVQAISIQQARAARRLDAAELANRLIIQYLDDDSSLPSQDLPIDYGPNKYRWKMSVSKIKSAIDESILASIEENASNRQSPTTPDRLRKVVVTVWLSEQSGGSYLASEGSPQATLVRIVDPSAIWRRPPDSIDNLINRPGGTEELLQRVLGSFEETE